MAMTTAEFLRHILMYLVVPLWFAAGLADYACHRTALIERTSGAKELVLHLVQFGQAGAALLAVLLLVTNAGVVIFLLACFVAHQATSIWDVAYANATRRVGPTEQHVHTILEAALPITIGIAAVLDWPAARSGFAIALRQPPLPAWYFAALAAAALVVVAAYGEELLRTLRSRRPAGKPQP